jgi:hypothetical protein
MRRTALVSCPSSMLSVIRVSLSSTASTWKLVRYGSELALAVSG